MPPHHVKKRSLRRTMRHVASMGSSAARSALTIFLFFVLVSPAMGIIVGGGGSARTDCLTVFSADANYPPDTPRHIRCADGDACDADGTVNGVCEFPIAVCANSTFNASCTLNGLQSATVDHALDNGDPKFDPEFQALQTRILTDLLDSPPNENSDDCTVATNFHVPVKGPFTDKACKKNKKILKLTSLSEVIAGKVSKDRDKIKLTCDPPLSGTAPTPTPPAPTPSGWCDPLVFYSGTFDRIQTQIFNQSCAVSGCHDSESQTGNLLLEEGASYGNLLNVGPSNAAAAAAGWKRIAANAPNMSGPCAVDVDGCTAEPCDGDLATSFLAHKVTGDLAPGFGGRMPLDRPKLDESLINVIQLWIADGAPCTGWVPGTF
jgi:hypothetical protein